MENGVVNLVNQLARDRYRHEIICLTESSEFENRIEAANVTVYELKKAPGKNPGMYVRFWRLLRRISPDIVHTRNLGTLDLAPVAVLAGVPIRIHSEHGWEYGDPRGRSRKYRIMRRIVDPAVSRYIAVSDDIHTWLCSKIGIAAARVQHICNGVDTERFHPRGAGLIPDDQNEDDRRICVGTVGRLDPIKGHGTLLESLARIFTVRHDLRDRIRLVIVGDGPVREDLETKCKTLGLVGSVELAGRSDDIPRALRDFDLFVLSSLNEGISNTILEAMASGLPVVATRVGGNTELVEDGVCGLLVPPQNADALAAAILTYLDDADLRDAHGRAARQRAEDRFSLPRMVRNYDQLYSGLALPRAAAIRSSRA